MQKALKFLFGGVLAVSVSADRSAGKGVSVSDEALSRIDSEIANLEAKLLAIDHIKQYAGSVNLQELHERDIE